MTQPPEGGPQQGPRFGTDPYDPSAVGGPMAEPRKFSRLKQLTLLSLAIFVVGTVLSMIPMFTGQTREQTAEQFDTMGMQYTDADLDGAVAGSITFTAAVLVVGLIVYLLIYFGLVKTKNWARVLGIVFAILGTLMMLFVGASGLLDPTGLNLLLMLLGLIGAVVGIFWLVTAFNGHVKAYLTQNVQS
ncbi:hypothetical protein GCM10027060_07470 [Nesterenkonia halophila]|uniref:hypothetical protein n=1 Tax=Nesterenkonia halophila TaxID=302044 RepID=UPI001290EC5E|nr:hypothetical protein [Nesterenkonia halophila]